jgi:adenylate cyclase
MNPNEPTTLAEIGLYKGYVGRWDEGLPMIAKALALDPHPPGWYYFGPFFDHYRKSEYEAALAAAQKIDMPDYIWAAAARVAAFGQLGRVAEAQTDIKRILELDPDFEATARQKREKWFRFQEPLLDQFMDGLRKAGLKIPEKKA